MLEELKESFGEAFTPEIQKEFENKINDLIDAKAQVIAEEQVQRKEQELDEMCEAFKDSLKEESKDLVDSNLNNLNSLIERYVDRCVDEFVKKHEEVFSVNENELKTNSIMHSLANVCKMAGISATMIDEGITEQSLATDRERKLSQQLREQENTNIALQTCNDNLIKMGVIAEVGNGLTNENFEKFEQAANNITFDKSKSYMAKLESIREAILKKNPQINKELVESESKNNSLSEQLVEANNVIRKLTQQVERSERLAENNNSLKNRLAEAEDVISELERNTKSIKEKHNTELRSLKERAHQQVEREKRLVERAHQQAENKKILKLKQENARLLQMGIITEFKDGMTLDEADKFERLAKNIPFEHNREYLSKLEDLKDTVPSDDVVEAKKNKRERCEDEDIKESTSSRIDPRNAFYERMKNFI